MASGFRFEPLAKIASGGTATVFVGAAVGDRSGAKVALKRPHPHVLDDQRQRATLLREARVAAGLHHPNIVQVREVEVAPGERGELQLVMDYVEGTALGTLIASQAEAGGRLPVPIAARIVLDAILGLRALHDQRDAEGRLLGLVHRDVSPQNILVGIDGVARLTDFGLAKAVYDGAPSTTQGTLKGKLGYMAPEYVSLGQVDPGVDVFAMGVVLWETLAGRRLFRGDNEGQTLDRVLHEPAPALATVSPELAGFDPVLARALAKSPLERIASAGELFEQVERAARACGGVAIPEDVGAYVRAAAATELSDRDTLVAQALTGRRRRALARPAGVLLAALASLLAIAALALRGHPGATPDPAVHPVGRPALAAMAPDAASGDESTPLPLAGGEPSPASSTTAAPVDSKGRRPTGPTAPTRDAGRSLPPNPYVHRGSSR